jgi:hypothetical protein
MDEKKIKNIAKLSSYGAYIDEEFIYTDSIVEGKNVIVGNIAEYVYDLEQEVKRLQIDTAREILQELSDFVDFETFREGYELTKVKRKLKEMAKEKGIEVE